MKNIIVSLLFWMLFISPSFAASGHHFCSANPIWPKGKETQKNLFVGFRTTFEAQSGVKVTFKITASSLYRCFLNGEFCGHGPARGPHGFFRVDQWDLSDQVKSGQNLLAVEVAGYNVNSFYLLDQPSFFQAEVLVDGEVVASTVDNGFDFEAGILEERVQKVQRYSFQRPFIEVYRLLPGWDRWRKVINSPFVTVECTVLEEKQLLPRRVPYPNFFQCPPLLNVAKGEIRTGKKGDKLWKDRSLTNISDKLKGFKEEELEVIPSIDLQKIENISRNEIDKPFEAGTAITLDDKTYHILDFGTNLTGFIGAKIQCREETQLYMTFDEILTDGDVDFKRLSCVNAISYQLQPGTTYEVESFEPYTLRYLKLIVAKGNCEINNIYLREYVNPDVWEAHFSSSNKQLNRLFDAGRETFRQNAVDIFMDCPSRERAGWLCDSYFTARTAFDLSRDTRIEKNFYENYLLPRNFKELPEGMLPMCYPADHYDGVFIPNWALWFVLELEEYLERSGGRFMVNRLESKINRLFKYFDQFENEDGLLENLESWVFVEWSAANKFVQDVNYPSNMLYAAALEATGRMYNKDEFIDESESIRETIRKQSFDGEFFVDNAMRDNNELKPTGNHSEVCQYFAFYFDIATPETHEKLWNILLNKFGPERKQTKAYAEVHEANAFIGNILRLEILSRYGHCQQILDESVDYYLYMADQTGTLWENTGAYASCNHGFASHIVHTLYRDVLGLYDVDSVEDTVRLRFTNLEIDWCEGRIPIEDGFVSLNWWKENGNIMYQLERPAGYEIEVENLSDAEVIPMP